MKISKDNLLSHSLLTVFISALLITGGCGKKYIRPSLKSLVNRKSGTLAFEDANGNVQTIVVKVTRTFHGTGPMTRRQEKLTVEYSTSVSGEGFKLEIDGDGGGNDQYITSLPRLKQQNGTYAYDSQGSEVTIYPITSTHMADYASEEAQLDINGIVYDRVLKVCLMGPCDNTNDSDHELLKEIFMAEGYGLVAFTTFDDASFYLLK